MKKRLARSEAGDAPSAFRRDDSGSFFREALFLAGLGAMVILMLLLVLQG